MLRPRKDCGTGLQSSPAPGFWGSLKLARRSGRFPTQLGLWLNIRLMDFAHGCLEYPLQVLGRGRTLCFKLVLGHLVWHCEAQLSDDVESLNLLCDCRMLPA